MNVGVKQLLYIYTYIAQKMPSVHTFYKKDADVTQVNSMPKRIPHSACMLKEFDLI